MVVATSAFSIFSAVNATATCSGEVAYDNVTMWWADGIRFGVYLRTVVD